MAKYFYQYFQIFSFFMYNESLRMWYLLFLKIYKRFDKEREKNTHKAVNEKRKTEKFVLCSIRDYFIKTLINLDN